MQTTGRIPRWHSHWDRSYRQPYLLRIWWGIFVNGGEICNMFELMRDFIHARFLIRIYQYSRVINLI